MLDGFIASSSHARRSIHSLSEHPLVPTFTTPRRCQSRDLILRVIQSLYFPREKQPNWSAGERYRLFPVTLYKRPWPGCQSRFIPGYISLFVPVSLYLCLSLATFVYLYLSLTISIYHYLSPLSSVSVYVSADSYRPIPSCPPL